MADRFVLCGWLVLQWLTFCVATADIPAGCAEGTSGETLPTCPTCGHPPVQKKKKKRSQGNKDRKNKYNREKRALKRGNEKEVKKQQADGSIPEEWQPRVVRVLETPVVPSTDCNGSSSSAVVTTSKEWEPRIVRVLEEPSVSLPDLNGDSVSGFKRGRTRQHQTVQPWGTKEWKSPEEIEAWKDTQSAVAGISSELEQVAVEEGPHSEAEAKLDIGGLEFTELETQPLPVRPDKSAFLYERYIQNAEVEQRIREERLEGSRRRIRERKNGAASERRDIIRPQPRDSAGRFIRRRVDREARGGKRKSSDSNRLYRSQPY
ncbi:hypothetical protein OUZ56_012269 [Daphnia magna]|uniref:Uncharacterized protein n=1 Tax=Daphnia magna TaxID=35525 RepID=A0ABQ9Z2I2_9CRUS|nr:hypothetical protein OUZ56_012269 [Daphnia magna]